MDFLAGNTQHHFSPLEGFTRSGSHIQIVHSRREPLACRVYG